MQTIKASIVAATLIAALATAATADSGLDGTIKLSHGRNFDAEYSATILEGSLEFGFTDTLFMQVDLFGNRYSAGSSSTSNAAALHFGYQITGDMSAGVFVGLEDWGYGEWQFYGAELLFETGAVETQVYAEQYNEQGGGSSGNRFGFDVEFDIGSGGSMGDIGLIAGAHLGSGDYDRTFVYLGATTTLNNGVTLEARVADNDGERQAFFGLSYDFGEGARFNRRGWHSFQGVF